MSVAGSGPFEFTDGNGRQVSIPLAALKIANGVVTVDSTAWPAFSSYSSGDTNVIKDLLAEYSGQQLTLAPSPAARPALTLTAVAAGPVGNNITATIAVTPDKSGDPALALMDIKVTEQEVYPLLSMTTIAAVLGDGTDAGSQPGLATVDIATLDTTKLPKDGQTASFTAPVLATDPATLHIVDDASATIVTLVARGAGDAGKFTKASVSHVDATAKTFTLTLQWENTATGAKLLHIASDLASLSYEVIVKPPASGIFSVPASTTAGNPLQLSGGIGSTAASATAFSGT